MRVNHSNDTVTLQSARRIFHQFPVYHATAAAASADAIHLIGCVSIRIHSSNTFAHDACTGTPRTPSPGCAGEVSTRPLAHAQYTRSNQLGVLVVSERGRVGHAAASARCDDRTAVAAVLPIDGPVEQRIVCRPVTGAELVVSDGGRVGRGGLLALVASVEDGVLERLTELQRHDVVEYRVDDGAEVVEDTGNVKEEDLAEVGYCADVARVHVGGQQTLGVKRGPAHEEGDDHGH